MDEFVAARKDLRESLRRWIEVKQDKAPRTEETYVTPILHKHQILGV